MELKRISLIVLIAATFCTAASADITFSGWGRAVITPFAFMGEHSSVSAATFTSLNDPLIGFSAHGKSPSEKIGFDVDFNYGGAKAGIGDNAKVWVQPFSLIKLTAGWFKEDDFRGKIGASEFGSWLVYSGAKGEDNIFSRFDASAGAHFKLEPLKWMQSDWNGLIIEGAFGSNALGSPASQWRAIYNLLNNEDNNTVGTSYPRTAEEDTGSRTVTIADVYKSMQIALGYRLPDIGLARAQFIGNNRNVFRWGEVTGSTAITDVEKQLMTGLNKTIPDADVIEAAFLYNGFEGLTVDLGFKIPMEYKTRTKFVVYPRVIGSDGNPYGVIENLNKEEYTIQRPYVVALGAKWTPSFLSALTIMLRTDVAFGGSIKNPGKVEVTNGFELNAWIMPSYRIFNDVTAGMDIGVDLHGEDTLKQIGVIPVPAQTEVSKYTDFGIGPWIELNLGGGRIRTGVTIMIPAGARYKYNENSLVYQNSPVLTGDPVISIPISFTYSF